MSTTIRIRNVPEPLHSMLKPRAERAGMSLSDFLLAEIRVVAAGATVDELRERIAGRTSVAPSVLPAEVVRRERDTR